MKKILLLLTIILLALFLRAAFLWIWYETGRGGQLSADGYGYHTLAENLMATGEFQLEGHPTARRPPLYPLLIAFLLKYLPFPLGIQVLQVFLGTVNCTLLYVLGRHMVNDKIGGGAAALMAIDYTSIRSGVAVMTETLFVFLLLASFYCLFRGRREGKTGWTVLAGVLTGLSLLTKDLLIFYYPFVVLWLLWDRGRMSTRILRALVFSLSMMAVIGPWIVRNSLVYGRPVLITLGAGNTFYLANNPSATGGTTGGDWELGRDTSMPVPGTLPHLDAANLEEEDRYLFEEALNFIRAHPERFLVLMGKKIINMWRPYQTDSPPWARWAAGLTYLPVVLLGLAGVFLNLRRFRDFFPVFALMGYVFLLHAVLIAHIRYRYPLMPFFMIFAAFTLFEIWRKGRTVPCVSS